MATIPRVVLDQYTAKLNMLSEASREAIARLLDKVIYTDTADLREQLIAILDPYLGAATDDAAAYAAEFYDTVRMATVGGGYSAAVESMRKPIATEKAIRAIVSKVARGGTLDSITGELLDRVDYEIKRAAGDCIMENSKRDPKSGRFARVPTGSETCDFCIMLASRGFDYLSANNAGADGHYHANCDCRIVPYFEGVNYQGYDPSKLREQWKKSGFKPETKNRRSRSAWIADSEDGLPGFDGFDDVKAYIYEAKDISDLEQRYVTICNIFGMERATSSSLLNAMKTAEKRLN